MNTIEKLAPCPFCGSTGAQFERIGTPRQSCIVACNNCGARHESSDEGLACGSSWNDRAQQAGGVPAGFVLVPVEPTREMLDAYVGNNGRFHSGRSDWAAMLAAAPSPSAVQPRKVTALMEDGRGMFLDFNDGTRVFYEVAIDHEIEDDAPLPTGIVTPKEPTDAN